MQPSASRIDNHYSKRKPRFRRSLSDPYESQLTSGGKTAFPVLISVDFGQELKDIGYT
jgi:hypothetical protein